MPIEYMLRFLRRIPPSAAGTCQCCPRFRPPAWPQSARAASRDGITVRTVASPTRQLCILDRRHRATLVNAHLCTTARLAKYRTSDRPVDGSIDVPAELGVLTGDPAERDAIGAAARPSARSVTHARGQAMRGGRAAPRTNGTPRRAQCAIRP